MSSSMKKKPSNGPKSPPTPPVQHSRAAVTIKMQIPFGFLDEVINKVKEINPQTVITFGTPAKMMIEMLPKDIALESGPLPSSAPVFESMVTCPRRP